MPASRNRSSGRVGRILAWWVWAFLAIAGRADLQFDVFVGYGSGGGSDGYVREASWFPVSCEIFNDGPPFDAVVEFSSRSLGGGQLRRYAVELPTNTRKRIHFPVFSGTSRYTSWDAKLLDSNGKVHAEKGDIRCKDISWETPIVGCILKSFGGMPAFPQIRGNRPELQPTVARMTPEMFPDNSIALEGLTGLYLNSEKALELKAPQISALLAWVHSGGHLVVIPEQAQDIASLAWLRNLMPCELGNLTVRKEAGTLTDWIAAPSSGRMEDLLSFPRSPGSAAVQNYPSLPRDPGMDQAEFPTFSLRLLEGQLLAAPAQSAIGAQARRGRGMITVLAFNPEREPFRSWKHRAWFWARLFGVPPRVFEEASLNVYGGWGIDSVIAAMIETRQVRKLPVQWLLALLLVYLVVIGPLDRWLLKRLNKPMLTWITFPAYVLFFSLLIYFIGFKLRAGITECNELHLVDVLPRNDKAELRGRSYLSLYSSSNARYKLGSEQEVAAFRSEFLGAWGQSQDGSRIQIDLKPKGFAAEVTVPVWTSLLYVNEWQESMTPPLSAEVSLSGTQLRVNLESTVPRKLTEVFLVSNGRLYALGEVPAMGKKSQSVDLASGQSLSDFVRSAGQSFEAVASSRRQAFGKEKAGLLGMNTTNLVAASFIGQMGGYRGNQRTFLHPPGFDLSSLAARGDAVILAWCPGLELPNSRVRKFEAPKGGRNTLLRIVTSVGKGGNL